MGSFTLDGQRQPGQRTKMILILLASTLLHLCRGHSLGTDLHTSQHGAEDNQRVEYDLITKAVTFNTRAKRYISDVHFTCPNIADRCSPERIGRRGYWWPVQTPEGTRYEWIRSDWSCVPCCRESTEGPLCKCGDIVNNETFLTCQKAMFDHAYQQLTNQSPTTSTTPSSTSRTTTTTTTATSTSTTTTTT